jgi:hypothetical protein
MKINLTEPSNELNTLIGKDRQVWVERDIDIHIVRYIYNLDPSKVVFINQPSDVGSIKDPNVDVAIVCSIKDLDIVSFASNDSSASIDSSASNDSSSSIKVLELVSIKEGVLPILFEACTIREATGYTSLTSQQIAAIECICRALSLAIVRASIPHKVALLSLIKNLPSTRNYDHVPYLFHLLSYLHQDYDRTKIESIYSPLLQPPPSLKLHQDIDSSFASIDNSIPSTIKGLILKNNLMKIVDIYKFIEVLKEEFPYGLYIESEPLIDQALNYKSVSLFLDFSFILSKIKPSGINLIDNSPKEQSFDFISLATSIYHLIVTTLFFLPNYTHDTNTYVSLYSKLHNSISTCKTQLNLQLPISISGLSKEPLPNSLIKKFSRYGMGHIFTGKLKTSEAVGNLTFISPTGQLISLPVVYFHPDCAITKLLGLPNLSMDNSNSFYLRNNIIALGRSPMGSWVFAVGVPSYEYGYVSHAHVSSLIASQAHASDGDGDPCSIFKIRTFLDDFSIEDVLEWNKHPMSLGGDDNSYKEFVSLSKQPSTNPITSSTPISSYLNLIDKVSSHYSYKVGSSYNIGSAISFQSSIDPSLASTCNIAWRGLYEQQGLSGWNPSRESCFNLLSSTSLPSLPVYQLDTQFSLSPIPSSTPIQPIPKLAAMLNCSYNEANTIFSFSNSIPPVLATCRTFSRGITSEPPVINSTVSISILDSLLWNDILWNTLS